MIYYKSTRGDKKQWAFSEVILKGIAPDGGLFVPTEIPKLSLDDLEALVGKSYQELCLFITDLFKTDFPKMLLQKLILRAYSSNFDHRQITPLIPLKNNQYVLELWHGPTASFKDMALQIMPSLFSEALKKDNKKRIKLGEKPLKYLILVATSGDTGKAALEGYKDKEGISLIVFYPLGGVSKLQELSMLVQEGNNLAVVGMKGDFDDAQRSMKEVFADKEFNQKLFHQYKILLSSANSINWGRLLPQIIYYVGSYVELLSKKVIRLGELIDIAVPTGNFGNIMAAFYARKMGVPIRRLICASNENNALTLFLNTGKYDIRNSQIKKTPSPSMDIIVASNLERLLYEIIKKPSKVKEWMEKLKSERKFEVDEETVSQIKNIFYADWVSNNDCLETIKKTYDETNYLMDPHTAVAQAVVERYQKKYKSDVPVVVCSTAHWSKFPQAVYRGLMGRKPMEDGFEILRKITRLVPNALIPENIIALQNKKIRHTAICQVGKEEVKKVILQYLSKY